MKATDLQEKVSERLINREVEEVTLGVTDNQNAVIVQTDDLDAAYTADEVRQLADKLEEMSEQEWNRDNRDVVEYIRDIADVVDNKAESEDIDSKWDEKGRQEEV